MADGKIKSFEIERLCSPQMNVQALSLREVDNSINHYSHKMIYLQDTDLVRIASENDDLEIKYSFALLLRYRQNWKPTGYGLGDLIYSVSLLPNEELTLETKTWETAKSQTETGEDIETRNLSDVSSEQTDSSELLHDLNTKENLKIDVHGEASWGWGSASVDAGYSNEVQEQTKSVNSHLKKGSERAVNEMKRDKSIKMTVSREVGSEEKTTRKIKNINLTHTLNINYYQILREFQVSLFLEEASLVMLGMTYTPVEGNVANTTVRPGTAARSSGVLQYPSLSNIVESLRNYSLDPLDPLRFQNTILKYTIPLPDISVEFGLYGDYRYAFLLNPGQEEELLKYMFMFSSGTVGNPVAYPVYRVGQNVAIPKEGAFKIDRSHFLYRTTERRDILKKINEIVDKTIEQLEQVKNSIGVVSESEWKTTLPTQGLYAETMLGSCSGGEDYIEINRQFDLELKKLEVERLHLEVEKLRIQNEQLSEGGKQVIGFENAPNATTLNVDMNLNAKPGETRVEFSKNEDN